MVKCQAEECDSYSPAKCDKCKVLFCVKCSASEHKEVSIKERSAGVTFKCPDYLQWKTAATEVEKNLINLSKAI